MHDRDRLRVFPHVNEIGAEVGLVIGLRIVQPDQPPPENDGDERADRRVSHADEKQLRADRPEHARKRDDGDRAVEQHEHERERVRGEGADVVGDALIRVGDRSLDVQPVVRPMPEVAVNELPRRPLPPHQAEALLDETVDDGRHGREGEDQKIADGVVDEAGGVAMRDRRHEVAPDVAVHDVQGADREQEGDQQHEHGNRLAADLGARESPQGAGEPPQRLARQPQVAADPALVAFAGHLRVPGTVGATVVAG